MKIVMVRANRVRPKSAGGVDEHHLVWWWRVREDDGTEIKAGVGWEFKKEASYGAAIQFMRAEQKRRETSDAG